MNNLYTLNHEAYDHPIQMDETFIDCLKLAMKMQSENSQFDISQGALLNLWHDARENTQVPPSDDKIQEALKHIDLKNIQINKNEVSYLDSELSIDLGAIAKGYTAQLAKEALNKARIEKMAISMPEVTLSYLVKKKMDPIGRLVFKVQIPVML